MMNCPMMCEYFSEHYSRIIFEDENIIVIQQGQKITVYNKADFKKNYLE